MKLARSHGAQDEGEVAAAGSLQAAEKEAASEHRDSRSGRKARRHLPGSVIGGVSPLRSDFRRHRSLLVRTRRSYGHA